jgi:hypothetical protein
MKSLKASNHSERWLIPWLKRRRPLISQFLNFNQVLLPPFYLKKIHIFRRRMIILNLLKEITKKKLYILRLTIIQKITGKSSETRPPVTTWTTEVTGWRITRITSMR